MKNIFMAFAAAIGLATVACGAPNYSCEATAQALPYGTKGEARKTVIKWVKETDPTTGKQYFTEKQVQTNATTHVVTTNEIQRVRWVCYYKQTLKRLKAYTVWIENEPDRADPLNKMSVDDVYAKSAESIESTEPDAWFEQVAVGVDKFGVTEYYQYMPADSWTYSTEFPEFNDPASWTYYILLRYATEYGTDAEKNGPPKDVAVVCFGEGNLLPFGIYENPKPVSFSTDSQTFDSVEDGLKDEKEYCFHANEFYFSSCLKMDRKYVLETLGGTSKYPLSVTVSSLGGITNSYPAASAYDQAMTFVSTADDEDTDNGRTRIIESVQTEDFDTKEVPFKLRYRVYPVRTIAEHEQGVLELGKADEEKAVTFKPGHLSNSMLEGQPGFDHYDGIVDSLAGEAPALYAFEVVKGRRYSLDTLDAQVPLRMRLYDAAGTVIGENKGAGVDDNCRIAWVSPTTGTNYVGVCEALADDDRGAVSGKQIRLTLTDASPINGYPDEWDAGDDEFNGATPLVPYPVTRTNESALVDTEGHGLHRLGRTDWSDWFSIAARKDQTFRFAVTPEDPSKPVNSLSVEVGYRFGKGLYGVSTKGSLAWKSAWSNQLSFTATANRMYYLRIGVADGQGFDSNYKLHVIGFSATNPGEQLGQLTVNMRGTPSAAFMLNSEKVAYSSGATLLLPAGSYKVNYASVTGFKAPPSENVYVTKGKRVFNKDGKYTDKFDPKDNYPAGKGYGATALTLKNTVSRQERTLWEDDPADNFQFDGKDGCYYDFSLADVKGDDKFRPLFSITNADGQAYEAVDAVHQLKLPKTKGKYILTVYHANPETEKGGSYTLNGVLANVGLFKFAKSEVSFKENAGYATVNVKRTQKDGRVRLRYETVAGTAKPEIDYIATRGELEWANGDGKDKTISVKLIPDLVPSYEGQEPKRFQIRIWVLKDGERDYDEYPIMIQRNDKAKTEVEEDFATVTLTEVSKAAPGTVAIEGFQDGDAPETVVTTPKKPVITVTAGNVLKLRVARQDGCNGDIGVKVAAKKGKAVEGVDFTFDEKSWTWADGEGDDRYVEIPTRKFAETKSFVESKTFTLSFSKTSGSPKFAASSVTVTIMSEFMAETLEKYAKSLPKAGGISVKAGKAGTWCRRANMSLEGSPLAEGASTELTWTLTGPGLFKIVPSFASGSGQIEYLVGKGKIYTALTPGNPVKALVDAGSQTVKVKFTAESEGAVPRIARSDEDGAPYRWLSLANLKPTPAVKSFIVGDGSEKFSWAVSPFCKDEGVRYRVCLAEKAGDLGKDGTILETGLTDPETKGGVTLAQGKSAVWRVDFSLDGENWVVSKTTWAVTAAASGAPVRPGISGKDAYGHDVSGGDVIRLVQGLKASFLPSGEPGTTFALANGKLPDGLKLATDKKTGITAISGVPTKAGSYSVVLQPTANKVKGVTRTLDFEVGAIEFAAGDFNGVFLERPADSERDINILTNKCPSIGTVKFSATAAGKLSATVTVGGKSYKFSSTGFDRQSEQLEEGVFGRELTAHLELVQKIAGVSHTNVLEVDVGHTSLTNLAALCAEAGRVRLTMAIPDANGKGAQRGIEYEGALCRSNVKIADYLSFLAPFVGYYTVSLPIETPEDGKPSGHGYLTLTVDAKGNGKVGGMLADGQTVSCAFPPAVVGDPEVPNGLHLVVPVFQSKGQYAFGGSLRFDLRVANALGDVWPVASCGSPLWWKNDDVTKAYTVNDNGSWSFALLPSGGWYDTVYNLQAYYLSDNFAVDAGASDNLPEELLPSDKAFVASTMPTGTAVDLVGDALSVPKQTLVKDPETKLYVWESAVNASKLTVSFKRATGLVSGTFGIWSEGLNAKGTAIEQKLISGAKHYGVLLGVRDDVSPLSEDVWTAGFFNWQANVPYATESGKEVSRKWTYSAPFNILSVGRIPLEEGK